MATSDTAPLARPPLRRPLPGTVPSGKDGVVAGVAAGLALHMGMPLWLVRLILVVLAPTGVSILLYAWLWIFVPRGNPGVEVGIPFTGDSRLANPNVQLKGHFGSNDRWQNVTVPAILLALGLITIAVFGAYSGPKIMSDLRPLIAIVVLITGIALIWVGASAGSSLVELRMGRFLGFAIPGALLVIFAVMLGFSGTISLGDALRGGLITLVVLAVLSLAVLPLWARFWMSYKASLAEQTRQTVRADMAAHLHDSVLQTLALIRARADDAPEVAKLARAEERQLRSWLYEDRGHADASLSQIIKELAGEIEDRYGVVLDTVTVGDAVPGPWSEPLVAATREALTNAARHGKPPFSMYLEVGTHAVECYVRDHGTGFDLAAIPQGHQGVKHSIIERLERHGGTATIRSGASGCEVAMKVPRQTGEN